MDLIRIKHRRPEGWALLARKDFNPAVHQLAEDAPAPVAASPSSTDTGAGPTLPPPPPPPPPADTAPSVATLTIAEAIPVIEKASREQVEAMQTQEAARTPPREGIRKALAARLEALTPQT